MVGILQVKKILLRCARGGVVADRRSFPHSADVPRTSSQQDKRGTKRSPPFAQASEGVLLRANEYPDPAKRKRETGRMGGDSNPRCLSAHTLSRRAQSTALSPIQNNLPLPLNLSLGRSSDDRNRVRLRGSARGRLSQLQAPEQFVER